MAELSKIRKNGVDYDLKDTVAREAASKAVKTINGNAPDENGNVYVPDGGTVTPEQIAQAVANYMAEHPVSGGGITPAASALLISILRDVINPIDLSARITALEKALAGGGGGDEPIEPDEPVDPEATLVSIIASYTGGDVAVGTALSALTGISVMAVYSDGSTATVTDYTLSGEIVEGENTITVTYEGLTETFAVTGIAAPVDMSDGYISDGLEFRLDAIRNTESGHDSTHNRMDDVSGNGYAVHWEKCLSTISDTYLAPSGENQRASHQVTDYATILAKMATFTVEVVWQPVGTPATNKPLFAVGNNNYLLGATGQMRLYDGTQTVYGTADTDNSAIKHFTITFDGANMNLYHEGVLDVSQPATTDITTAKNCEFFACYAYSTYTYGYFNAARIYTRALSADEVKANYDNDIARFGTVNVEVEEVAE